MSFTTILKKLRLADLASRAIADDDYGQLVADAAADRSVSESRIGNVLKAAGKTLADLEKDISAEQERLRNLSVAARRDEVLSALSENNAARIQADRDYASAVEKLLKDHGHRVEELQARDRELSDELRRIEAAERKLIATEAPDRLAEIDRELRELVNQERRLSTITLQSDRSIQRQREAIPGKRAALMEERDRIRAEILTSN